MTDPYSETIMTAIKLIGSKKQDAEKQKQARMAAVLGKMPGSGANENQEGDPKANAIGGLLDKFLNKDDMTQGPKRQAIVYGKPRLADPTGGQLNSLGFDGDRSYEDDLSLLGGL